MASGNIDERIAKAEEEVVKAKARYDEAVKALEALMAKRPAGISTHKSYNAIPNYSE